MKIMVCECIECTVAIVMVKVGKPKTIQYLKTLALPKKWISNSVEIH